MTRCEVIRLPRCRGRRLQRCGLNDGCGCASNTSRTSEHIAWEMHKETHVTIGLRTDLKTQRKTRGPSMSSQQYQQLTTAGRQRKGWVPHRGHLGPRSGCCTLRTGPHMDSIACAIVIGGPASTVRAVVRCGTDRTGGAVVVGVKVRGVVTTRGVVALALETCVLGSETRTSSKANCTPGRVVFMSVWVLWALPSDCRRWFFRA